ncbi:MAG: gas vesicle protein K [Candidatus Latescibacteria bacterium]|nr:gas vesicle protein K [Candidatus Latescibacterota bacterium]
MGTEPRGNRAMRSPEVDSDFLEEFAEALSPESNPQKVNVDPEKVEHELVKLVLALVELLRQLMERQAIRRMETGNLTMEEIDRLGLTLMKLEKKMKELQEHFQIDDLNIRLGPLGNLLD